MSFRAKDLRVGDVVSKPNGFMDWPKWEHIVVRQNGEIVHTIFSNGMSDSSSRHGQAVIDGHDWMSIENMQYCLEQPDTVVDRPTANGLVRVWPVEGADA